MIIQHVHWKVVYLSKPLVTSHRKEVEDTDFTRVCSVDWSSWSEQPHCISVFCSVAEEVHGAHGRTDVDRAEKLLLFPGSCWEKEGWRCAEHYWGHRSPDRRDEARYRVEVIAKIGNLREESWRVHKKSIIDAVSLWETKLKRKNH